MKDMHIHLKKGVLDYEVMREYVKQCISLGISEVVFLDHGNRIDPKHIPVLKNEEVIGKFFSLIEKARDEFPNITIHKGIEVDFSFDKKFREREFHLMSLGFDVVIGSVHGLKKLNLSREEYYDTMLKMVQEYPMDVLAHLKLYDDYLEHDSVIRKILEECHRKDVKIEINTSDRSVWTLAQMDYMMNLMKEYKIEYTVGSDAHAIEEIGINFDFVYDYLNQKISSKTPISYSIVSRGTEKSGSKGYMAVTEKVGRNRYLVIQDHSSKYADVIKDSLNCKSYDILNIALSRFELISALTLEKIPFPDSILLCGLGNVGIGALIYLLDSGYQDISIYVDSVKPYMVDFITTLNEVYSSHIQFVDEMKSYEVYIDTTGVGEVYQELFESISPGKMVFLIGTPREEDYLISPLMVHRKNLMVIGGHELKGVPRYRRITLFQELLKKNKKKKFLDQIVHVNSYEEGLLDSLLKNKNHFIEVISYEDRS